MAIQAKIQHVHILFMRMKVHRKHWLLRFSQVPIIIFGQDPWGIHWFPRTSSSSWMAWSQDKKSYIHSTVPGSVATPWSISGDSYHFTSDCKMHRFNRRFSYGMEGSEREICSSGFSKVSDMCEKDTHLILRLTWFWMVYQKYFLQYNKPPIAVGTGALSL